MLQRTKIRSVPLRCSIAAGIASFQQPFHEGNYSNCWACSSAVASATRDSRLSRSPWRVGWRTTGGFDGRLDEAERVF